MPKRVPFHPGDVIEEHGGKLYGVLAVEKKDGGMSRYTLHCFDDGVDYYNMPHYTMKLKETIEAIQKRNQRKDGRR